MVALSEKYEARAGKVHFLLKMDYVVEGVSHIQHFFPLAFTSLLMKL